MKECPKCGHMRRPEDDRFASAQECPRCGIVYARYTEEQASPVDSGIDMPREEAPCESHARGNKLARAFSRIRGSSPAQFLFRYRDSLASLLFLSWVLGCGYWIYLFIVTDAQAQACARLPFLSCPGHPKEALTMLFFGMIACIFILIGSFFTIKFVYNMILGGVERLLPKDWNAVIRAATLLMLLYFFFPLVKPLKETGVTAYYQVCDIVHMARQHKLIMHVNAPGSDGILENEEILKDLHESH